MGGMLQSRGNFSCAPTGLGEGGHCVSGLQRDTGPGRQDFKRRWREEHRLLARWPLPGPVLLLDNTRHAGWRRSRGMPLVSAEGPTRFQDTQADGASIEVRGGLWIH